MPPAQLIAPAIISNRLRELALRFGALAERRVYHDPSKTHSVVAQSRKYLDAAGFTLVDCPAHNAKESIDKKIIVDVMHFVMSRPASQTHLARISHAFPMHLSRIPPVAPTHLPRIYRCYHTHLRCISHEPRTNCTHIPNASPTNLLRISFE